MTPGTIIYLRVGKTKEQKARVLRAPRNGRIVVEKYKNCSYGAAWTAPMIIMESEVLRVKA